MGAAIVSTLVGGAGAQAATVTLGSPLGSNLSPQEVGNVGTISQLALPGATTTAPFNGMITSWRVIGASGGPFRLRVVHPAGPGLFTGAGTATSGPLTSQAVLTFPASLPIKAGDVIGIEATSVDDTIGSSGLVASGASLALWAPPLADGEAGRAPSGTLPIEVGFNATVVSNCIVPKLKGKKAKAAKRALRDAGCAPGKVKKKKGAGKGAKVKKQNPAPGSEVPAGTAVNLKLAAKR